MTTRNRSCLRTCNPEAGTDDLLRDLCCAQTIVFLVLAPFGSACRDRSDLPGATARPREVVKLLLGEAVEEHRMRRDRLLMRDESGFKDLRSAQTVWRDPSRRQGMKAAK